MASVVVNGYTSEPLPVLSGVPQGSHLGPILFNIFINDVVSVLNHSRVYHFADDLKLCREITSPNDKLLLQSDLDGLADWVKANQMDLNTDKCHFIRFTRGKTIASPTYYINGMALREVDCIRDLGVTLDKQLRFNKHIDNITCRAFKMLGFVIRSCKELKSPKTKTILYNAYVRPILQSGLVASLRHLY